MTWILPSRERTTNLKRLFRSFREFGISTPGLVLVNEDELIRDKAKYDSLDLPKDWSVRGVRASCFYDAWRAVFDEIKSLSWVGLLQDDLVAASPGWDEKLISALNGWNVVSADDGRGTNRMHGAIAWSGELVRALGWLYPPGFRHLYGDDVWETVSRETGVWSLRHDSITRHLNETYSVSGDRTAARIMRHTEHDKARFESWLKGGEKDEMVAKIRALQAAKGMRMINARFAGKKIMIGTPSIDGRYDDCYVESLLLTMQYLASQGVAVEWAQEKHNADISLARSKILGTFLRSNCTHLLCVDSDMGWGIDAVVRLVAAEKDIVAVAGPKKSYPLRFAANHSDAAGNMIPLRMEIDSGTCEVSEVGLAFALISRGCAEKMIRSYPEMRYRGITTEIDSGLFIPFVENERYFAEDFAFCKRWRVLGGRIFICPDVRLKHKGGHVFEGALLDAEHAHPTKVETAAISTQKKEAA